MVVYRVGSLLVSCVAWLLVFVCLRVWGDMLIVLLVMGCLGLWCMSYFGVSGVGCFLSCEL